MNYITDTPMSSCPIASSCREPLADISNIFAHDAPPSTRWAAQSRASTTNKSSVSTATTSRIAKPKLLRQTSLFAFAARSSSPAPIASSSSATPNVASSPVLQPTNNVFQLSRDACDLPPSDEGYNSTFSLPASSISLSLDGIEGEGSESDEHESDTSSTSRKRQKRARVNLRVDENDANRSIPSEEDTARALRRQRLQQRNAGLVSGPAYSDAWRLREYSQTNHDPYARILQKQAASRAATSYLNSYVSQDIHDVFTCTSERNRDYAPPFACAFANVSKRGGRKILAVADEEGVISLVRADDPATSIGAGVAAAWSGHRNAIFDLRWSNDDKSIATGSGDQTGAIFDVEHRVRTATLAGHTCSVKQVAWDPASASLLSSASRDGSIGIWDIRVRGKDAGTIALVNHIRFAHDAYAKSRRIKDEVRSCTRSVTSIVYLNQPGLLASGGSADGIIKVWDLRKTVSKRINPPSVEQSGDYTFATPVRSMDTSSGSSASSSLARSYGVASLALAPDGGRLYALSTNSKIFAHDTNFVSRDSVKPLHTFTSPYLLTGSFYIRICISPDGKSMAAGTSHKTHGVNLWDLERSKSARPGAETSMPAATVHGHSSEIGGMDWAHDMLATCADDNLVRVWRPDSETRDAAMASKDNLARWRYSGRWGHGLEDEQEE